MLERGSLKKTIKKGRSVFLREEKGWRGVGIYKEK